jgi:outer membrane protein TolC
MKEAWTFGAVWRACGLAALLTAVLGGAAVPAHASDTVEVQGPGGESSGSSVETVVVHEGGGLPGAAAPAAGELGSDIEPLDITPQWDITRFDISRFRTPSDAAGLIQYLSEHYAAQDKQISIDEAVRLALAHNHDLNSKRLYALAACQGKEIIWADLNPQLSLQGDAHYQVSNSDVAGQDDKLYKSLALQLTKRIYDFGLTRRLIDANAAQLGIRHYTVSMAEQQLVANVVSAYFSFSLALGELRIREDELGLAQKFLEQAQIQFDVGTVPKLDVIRAEARVQQAQAAHHSAQAQLGDSAAYFYSLLGVEDARYVPLVVTAELIDMGSPPAAPQLVVDNAINHRPEIQIQYNTMFAGEAKIDLARNRPILQAYANGRWANPSGATGSLSGQFGVQLLWDIYTGGKDQATREQAETELKALSEAVLDLEAKVELDATTSWNNLVKLRANTLSARKNLDLSGEALRVAAIGYGAGVTPYIDYESALNNNVSAALGYLISLIQVKQAQISLLRAQGFPGGYPGLGGNTECVSPSISELLGQAAPEQGWSEAETTEPEAAAPQSEPQTAGSIQQP